MLALLLLSKVLVVYWAFLRVTMGMPVVESKGWSFFLEMTMAE